LFKQDVGRLGRLAIYY